MLLLFFNSAEINGWKYSGKLMDSILLNPVVFEVFF